MVDFVPFPGMASTDNNTQYPANEVMITGNGGTVTASGSMVVVPSTGNVGIGSTSPAVPFDVNVYAVFRQNVTVNNNLAVGGNINIAGAFTTTVLINNTTPSINTITGALVNRGGAGIAGNLNVGGTVSTFAGALGIGTSSGVGIATTPNSSNLWVYGNLVLANTSTTSSGVIFPDGTVQTTAGAVASATRSYGLVNTIQVAGTSNAFAGDSSNFVWDNTNKRLGIGTSTPAYLFSLYGTDNVLFNNRPGSAARQEITVGNVIGYGSVLGYDPSIGQSIGYLRRGDSAATSPAITWAYVSSNYRVGINAITQPQNAMDIAGAVAIGSSYSGFGIMTNANGLSVQGQVGIGTFTPNTSTSNVLTMFNSTGAGLELASGGAGGGAALQAITGGGLKFSTFTGGVGSETWSETMRINSSGYLGINTNNPVVRFNIGNSANGANEWAWFNTNSGGATPNASMTTGLAIGGNYSGGGSEANLVYGTYLTFAKWTGSTYSESMRITSTGNISMGTTGTAGFLTVQRGGGASTAADISTSDGTQVTYINSNWASGSYNPYVQASDHGIIFHNGSAETGQFVISQWSSISKGLRINTSGNVAMANNLTVSGEVYAYYSDRRLKDNIAPISNAINIINHISGVYYNANDLAVELLREDKTARRVGVLAQDVQAVMPEVVRQAPFDIAPDGSSISGENYQTVQYDKLVPLLIQAVKEQSAQITDLQARLAQVEGRPDDH